LRLPDKHICVPHPLKFTRFAGLLIYVVVMLVTSGCSTTGLSIKKPSLDNAMGECVVLLHGMGRTYRSMGKMQDALTRAGYHTVNLGYPSTKKDIESIVAENFPYGLEQCGQFNPTSIHFVTHSLGGIVTRSAIKENRPKKLGRVVMLSPPNKGSAVVDDLKDRWYYSWLNGPAGQQLSTAADSVPNQLGPVDYPVGIITGDRHAFFDGWLSNIIPGVDDGKVSVERAKVDGMTDFLVVHQSHPYIMNSEYVHAETVHFLGKGIFTHANDVQLVLEKQ
jgi:triacylglycerol lipase